MRWLICASLAFLVAGCAGSESLSVGAHNDDVQVASTTATVGSAQPAAARIDETRFVTRDGTVLPLRRWMPEGRPKAVVLALHGFNDYSNAFSDVGPSLAQDGVATFAYDQRGFGAAPGRGRWAGEARFVDDAATAVGLLHRHYPGTPVYLMGESMGGALAILTASHNKVAHAELAGVILVAPAVWGRQEMNVVERVGLWLADLMPSVTWTGRGLPVTIIPSDNYPMLRAFSADPLVIKATRSDAINGLVDVMSDALEAAPRFDVPALILYGEHDQLVPPTPVKKFLAGLPAHERREQRLAFYPQGYHMLLRDLDGAMIVQDIAAWIAKPSAALPSEFDGQARERLFGPTETPRSTPLTTASR